MIKMSTEQELKYLETEMWGVLSFELNLPALYRMLEFDKKGIDYSRFFYMALFPKEIPEQMRTETLPVLANRKLLPWYESFVKYSMNDWESFYHYLAIETMTIKHKEQVSPDYLQWIYRLPMNVFYYFSLKLIENNYLSSQQMFQIYTNYLEKNANEQIQ